MIKKILVILLLLPLLEAADSTVNIAKPGTPGCYIRNNHVVCSHKVTNKGAVIKINCYESIKDTQIKEVGNYLNAFALEVGTIYFVSCKWLAPQNKIVTNYSTFPSEQHPLGINGPVGMHTFLPQDPSIYQPTYEIEEGNDHCLVITIPFKEKQ